MDTVEYIVIVKLLKLTYTSKKEKMKNQKILVIDIDDETTLELLHLFSEGDFEVVTAIDEQVLPT